MGLCNFCMENRVRSNFCHSSHVSSMAFSIMEKVNIGRGQTWVRVTSVNGLMRWKVGSYIGSYICCTPFVKSFYLEKVGSYIGLHMVHHS